LRVNAKLMSQFARLMRDRALAVEAINERLRKIDDVS